MLSLGRKHFKELFERSSIKYSNICKYYFKLRWCFFFNWFNWLKLPFAELKCRLQSLARFSLNETIVQLSLFKHNSKQLNLLAAKKCTTFCDWLFRKAFDFGNDFVLHWTSKLYHFFYPFLFLKSLKKKSFLPKNSFVQLEASINKIWIGI